MFHPFSRIIPHVDERFFYRYTEIIEKDFIMKKKIIFSHTPNDDPRPTRTFSSSFTVTRLPSEIGINSTLQLILFQILNVISKRYERQDETT